MRSDLLPEGEDWRSHADPGGFEALIGPIYWRRIGDGRRFGFRAGTRHANQRGVVHGGMLTSFADHLLGVTVWEAVARLPCATASLSCDFMSAARVGEWIEGEAAITRMGTALVFVQGTVSTGDRPLLAATGIWKVLGRA